MQFVQLEGIIGIDMIKELMYKWFGLEELPCRTCEVLRAQLDFANQERSNLLDKLLQKDVDSAPVNIKELQPIKPQYIPWRVRQQMMEVEDRHKAQLMKDRAAEINNLEKELEIPQEKSDA